MKEPRQRVVMLGASNLSRAFPTAVTMSQHALGGPLDFFVAKGHGRSYGQVSSCLGKKISGIFSCGIWRALGQEKSVPITAFVTDIGNDLAYEASVESVVEWVSGCLDRLTSLDARVLIGNLPIESLRTVGARRYRLMRSLLFPKCRLSWNEMLERAEQLSQQVQELAKSRNIPVFIGEKEWYGFDPIHPPMRYYPEMWSQILSRVTETTIDLSSHRSSLGVAWYLRRLQPESWSFLSLARRASQPHGRLRDGSTLSLY